MEEELSDLNKKVDEMLYKLRNRPSVVCEDVPVVDYEKRNNALKFALNGIYPIRRGLRYDPVVLDFDSFYPSVMSRVPIPKTNKNDQD